jgi:hypothetical protein
MAIGQHICMRLSNDAVIASTPAERRTLARVVLEKGREADLLAFGQADNHLHLETASRRAEAGRLAHDVEVSLRRRLAIAVPFAPAFIKPIEDARHLYATFRYVLRQRAHHGLEGDPLREASNLLDLLGLRTLGRYTRANVRRLLPRVTRADLLELLGVAGLAPREAPLEEVVDAALSALTLPGLAGFGAEVQAARRAVVEVVGGRVPARVLGSWIGVGERTVFRLAARRADDELVCAVRLQLDLRCQLRVVPPDSAFAA